MAKISSRQGAAGLRARAEEQLGAKFGQREFHDVVLQNGALPLEIIEQLVSDYIATRRS